jgi:hypothetical protein
LKTAKCKIGIICLGIGWLLCAVPAAAQSTVEKLFQDAVYTEEVLGDLKRALALYRQVADSSRAWYSAMAQFRIGSCYEKMGDPGVWEAYRRVVSRFPDDLDAVAMARIRLSRRSENRVDIHPLVSFYLDRFSPDPLTAVSWDGEFIAYTDWESGDLMVKSRWTDSVQRVTNLDFKESHSFALRPAWSRDGKFIAFSLYKDYQCTELWIANLENRISKRVYQQPEHILYANTWTPDYLYIICEMFHYKKKDVHQIVMLDLKSGKFVQDFHVSSRSRKFDISPDGKYIAYEHKPGEDRHIYLKRIPDGEPMAITQINLGDQGYDNPVWSPDGKMIMYRSNRRGRYDLWARRVSGGKPDGPDFVLQPDLMQSLFTQKGISESSPVEENPPYPKTEKVLRKPEITAFQEEFSDTVLSSQWIVYQWNRPNLFSSSHFGHYSLTDQAGHLRYYLDPASLHGWIVGYLPNYSGIYWYYPSMELRRLLWGDRWVLETRVTYFLLDRINGRTLVWLVLFGGDREFPCTLKVTRNKDWRANRFFISLSAEGKTVFRRSNCQIAGDTLGVSRFTYDFRVVRYDSLLRVSMAEKGRPYEKILEEVLPENARNRVQWLVLTGSCWFAPAGAYAEYDYFRFNQLEQTGSVYLKESKSVKPQR